MKRVLGLGVLVAFGIVVACSSSDDDAPPNYSGSCATLASQCHPYSEKSALGKECHELGHAGDDSKCGPRLAQCQAECPPIDGGGHLPFEIVDGQVVNLPDASTADGNTDATTDSAPQVDKVCNDYCNCLTPTCGSQTGYPYANIEQCRATCTSKFTADEKTCWPKFCDRAKALSEANRQHECQHAMGFLDLDECDEI